MCKLLRTKVFPNSPFSDHSDSSITPPASPRLGKRLKLSTSAKPLRADNVSSQPQTSRQARAQAILKLERVRSRSLSVSLEEERERSRSANIGSNRMRNKTLIREVSMTTVFKDKGKSKSKDKAPQESRQRPVAMEAKKPKDMRSTGVTLVKATPVKPKANIGRNKTQRYPSNTHVAGPQASTSVLTTRHASGKEILRMEVEGEGDDEENQTWDLPGSPDVLLFNSYRHDPRMDSEPSCNAGGRTLVESSPIKDLRR